MRSHVTAVCSLLWLCSGSLFAQVSAGISGTVTDPSGGLVAEAAVTVTNTGTSAARRTLTGPEGEYRVSSLPVGAYEIRAIKPGFAEVVRTGVHLVVGQDATVDLTLSVGQASQQVTVNADAPMVSVTTQDASGLVGERQIHDLPLNGRSYDELMTLNPGVVNFTWEKTGGVGVSNSTSGNNFVVEGNRPQQNLYLLNGVEFTGAAENNMQPGGVSQELLGVDAVEEYDFVRDFVGTIADAGCNVFIVHARNAILKGLSPKENREIPPLKYDYAYQLKRDFPHLEIIINGGIKTLDEVEQHLQHVDGVMLGREAYHNPYVLADVDARFYGATDAALTREEVEARLIDYCAGEIARGTYLGAIVRHALGLYRGEAGARGWRRVLSDSRKLAKGDLAIFDEAREHLRVADEILE